MPSGGSAEDGWDVELFDRFDFFEVGALACGAELNMADSSSGVRWYVREMKRKCVNVYGSPYIWKSMKSSK